MDLKKVREKTECGKGLMQGTRKGRECAQASAGSRSNKVTVGLTEVRRNGSFSVFGLSSECSRDPHVHLMKALLAAWQRCDLKGTEQKQWWC